jgi:hypothetical protein
MFLGSQLLRQRQCTVSPTVLHVHSEVFEDHSDSP